MAWSVSRLALEIWYVLAEPFGKWCEGFISVSPLDEETWERLRQELDFSEKSPEVPEMVMEDPSNFNFPLLMEVLRFAGIALIVVLLVVIVIRLLAKKKRRSKKLEIIGDETINEVYVDTPIEVLWKAFEASLGSENYREALRILYQISVKKLSAAGIVQSHPDKTNWEYVSEIQEPEKAHEFSKITLVYENHWYGDEALSQQAFEKYRPLFVRFIEALPDEE